MIFVDSNVLIDILQNDPVWSDWSWSQLRRELIRGEGYVNAIVLAELSRNFATLADAQDELASLDLSSLAISDAVAFDAGRRFAAYRRDRDRSGPSRLLPDFFIGAHAAALNATLVTRDAAIYRRHFPDLPLITPDTHPHG